MNSSSIGNPAAHPPDCKCGIHDQTPRDCPYPDCWAVGPDAMLGVRRLGHHIAWTHKRRKRGFTRVVVPDGTGWLKGVLRDPKRMAGLHLESLPRFARWLNEQWEKEPRRQRKRARLQIKAHLEEAQTLSDRSPNEPWRVPVMVGVEVPAALGEVMCLLSLETNVQMRYIMTALLCYGVEALAKELRGTSYSPHPRIPTAVQAKNA